MGLIRSSRLVLLRPQGARRLGLLKRKLKRKTSSSSRTRLASEETLRRNVAADAVRDGSFWAEPEAQHEVLAYIRELYETVLADAATLAKKRKILLKPNALTRRYTVEELLAKKHEEEGYDIFFKKAAALPEVPPKLAEAAKAAAKIPKAVLEELGGPALELPELQDCIDQVVSGKAGAAAGVADIGTLTQFVEACAKLREVAAAVFCCERLLASCSGNADEGGTSAAAATAVPDVAVDRCFDALKVFLGPQGREAFSCVLNGPWKDGKFPSNPKKSLGRSLARLSELRKNRGENEDTEPVKRAKRGQEVLQRLAAAVACRVSGSPNRRATAERCKRRVDVAALIQEISAEAGVTWGHGITFGILGAWALSGIVKQQGRCIQWIGESANDTSLSKSNSSLTLTADEVDLLQEGARARQKRRKNREESKFKRRDVKRQRTRL